jgi:ABC-type transport system involved in multi-copper enzyme maturation permease subunit
MRNLLWKDLVVGKWFWVAAIPIYLGQLVAMSDIPPAYVLLTLIGTSFFAVVSLVVEEMQGTEVLWLSLPVSRSRLVYARYAAVALGVAFGLGASWAVAAAVARWLGPDAAVATQLGWLAYISLGFVPLMGTALFLPCYFRFGAGRGLQVFSALVVGILLLGAIVGPGLALLARGSYPLPERGSPTPEQLVAIGRWFDEWAPVLSVSLVVLAAVTTTFSALISVQFYRVRDY